MRLRMASLILATAREVGGNVQETALELVNQLRDIIPAVPVDALQATIMTRMTATERSAESDKTTKTKRTSKPRKVRKPRAKKTEHVLDAGGDIEATGVVETAEDITFPELEITTDDDMLGE
jgi:hypothetical protein